MTLRNLTLLPSLLTLLAAAPGCDDVAESGGAEPHGAIIVDEDNSLEARDLVDADAVVLFEAAEADADADVPWTPIDAIAGAPDPSATCEYSWKEYTVIDNACGSCAPQPNMPGWKQTVKSRLCNCYSCNNWVTEAQYCNHC